MKKVLIALLAVVSVLLIFIYLFIPNTIVVLRSKQLNNNIPGLYRVLSNQAGWQRWWPEKQAGKDSIYTLHKNQYSLKDKTTSSIFLEIENKNFKNLQTSFNFIPHSKDSLKLEISTKIATSNNPFTRVNAYFLSKDLARDFNTLLNSIDSFYSSTENMYGMKIKRGSVKNTIFITTSDSVKAYPSSENIYRLIDELRQYVVKEKAQIIDSPMVNIYTRDSINYILKVALPINKEIGNAGKISFKRMLPGGNMITSTVSGGVSKINNAFTTIEQYMDDYHFEAPAIPFYALIINRLQQPDTTKWKGEINYPVMFY